MKIQSIVEYNQNLVNSLSKVKMNDYFNDVHYKYYNHICTTFMNYFIELSKHKDDDYFINTDKLLEFDVLKDIKDTSKIKRYFNKHDIIENEDYQINIVKASNRCNNKNVYTLNRTGFIKCLFESKNKAIYYKYYMLLETIHGYYCDYQLAYEEKINSQKDDKIDELKEMIKNQDVQMNKQAKKMNKQNKKIDKLMIYAEDTNNMLREVLIIVKKLVKINYRMFYSINEIVEHTKILTGFIHIKRNFDPLTEYKYIYTLRYCQLSMFTNRFKKLTENRTDDGYEIYEYEVFGIVQDNMLVVQHIYNHFNEMCKSTKSIKIDRISDVRTITNYIKNRIINNKHADFDRLLTNNPNVTNKMGMLNQAITEEDDMNTQIIDCITNRIDDKVMNNGQFRCMQLCHELNTLIPEIV